MRSGTAHQLDEVPVLERRTGVLQDVADHLAVDARRGIEAKGDRQQISDLQVQLAQLQDQEEKLIQASQRLQAKVEAFRTKKETIKATYSAAEAQTKINEAFSGISEELGDVGLAVQRAEDKTAQMQARGQAIDELLASGALDDATGTSKDSITAELERMASTNEVESQLAAMKAQIGSAPETAAIEGLPRWYWASVTRA